MYFITVNLHHLTLDHVLCADTKCTGSLLFLVSCAAGSWKVLEFQQDGAFTVSWLSSLTVQVVIVRNLVLLEWNSKYLMTGSRNALGPSASFHINSVDTRLIWGELEGCIKLVLSNDEK